jgi:hypothetical protein
VTGSSKTRQAVFLHFVCLLFAIWWDLPQLVLRFHYVGRVSDF